MVSKTRYAKELLRCALLVSLFATVLNGQSKPDAKSMRDSAAAVTVNHQALFSVRGVLSFSADDRAAAISRRIEELSKEITFKPDALTTIDAEGATDIVANDVIVMSVTDQDAKAAGESRQALAQDHADRIRAALIRLRKAYSLKSILIGALSAVLATLIFFVILRLLSSLFPKLYRTLRSWQGTRIRSLRIQKFELLPAYRITEFVVAVARLLRFAILLTALYFYVSVVLSFFPWTRGYAEILVSYLLSPLRLVGAAFVSYLPNVFFIAVIGFVAIYVIKLIKVIFTELGRGTITIPGFYPEWSEPTYKIARFLAIALTIIVIFPYLPGSHSPAFRGVSIFSACSFL